MPRFEDFINSSRAYQERMSQADQKAKAGMTNPLAVLAGLVAGGLTGGVGGAAMGGLSALGTSEAEGGMGVAKAGLSGYTTGKSIQASDLKDKYTQMLAKPKSQEEFLTAIKGLYPEETIKAVLAEKPAPLITGEGYKAQSNPILDMLRKSIGTGMPEAKQIKVISPEGISGTIDESEWPEYEKQKFIKAGG
jgi:hypothetical protein